MPSDDSLLDAIRAAYARVGDIEMVARDHPGDQMVIASLQSLRAHAVHLEQQWIEECRHRRVEVCRYKLLSGLTGAYSVTSFAKSLLEFQELFAQIFDAKRQGAPKRRAIVSGEVVSETAFDFAYSYPGSLGVVLTLEDRPNLFGGYFETAIAAFQQVTSIKDEDDVRDVANTLGEAVVKRIYDWSTVNYFAGFSVDVTWTGFSETYAGQLVDREELGRIIELISKTGDVEKTTVRVIGTLVAIDVLGKRFRLVVPDGDDFRGSLSETFDLGRQWAVNRTYAARIAVEAVTRYTTQRTEVNYRLENLETEFPA
jgi:hypothetical protein